MESNELITGQSYSWTLRQKLGEGDAGEVYRVESLLDKRAGILKRPHRSAFATHTLRQAAQIETEGKILSLLGGTVLANSSTAGAPRVRLPALLDRSKPDAEYGEGTFIIIEEATGFDLNTLARLARFGQGGAEGGGLGTGEIASAPRTGLATTGATPASIFAARLAEKGRAPDLVLLRALAALAALFAKIHTATLSVDGRDAEGVIWNDVKPEHLFWDPAQGQFTIIDWGNGQFLDADGGSRDRRTSRNDDYMQLVQEMGKFLADAAPDLHARLEWPGGLVPANAYAGTVQELMERVEQLLQKELQGLNRARQKEDGLIHKDEPTIQAFRQLEQAQERILEYGELPNYAGAEKLALQLAARLAEEGRLADLKRLCEKAVQSPGADSTRWALLGQTVDVAAGSGPAAYPALRGALQAMLDGDWPAAFWEITLAAAADPRPLPWDELGGRIREMQAAIDPASPTPYISLNRLVHTLQADFIQRGEPPPPPETGSGEPPAPLWVYGQTVQSLREEVCRKWPQAEPDPPNSGLEYKDVDVLIEQAEGYLPGSTQALSQALDQPRAQVKIVMDAWGRKEFETARRGLRRVLFWDPERRRVFQAEQAILAAEAWLESIYRGPSKDDTLSDFVTCAELDGRELRNQVGPARWLDLDLEALTALRKGARPADLFQEQPELLSEMPWLSEHEAPRILTPKRTQPIVLEREQTNPAGEPFIRGVKEALLGPDQDVLLAEPLDTWAPEARGSSARVFLGYLRGDSGPLKQAAVKVMRPGHADYALPLFREEAQILMMLRDVPGVTGLLECGFILPGGGVEMPADDRAMAARDLTGSVLRYGLGDIQGFLSTLESKTEHGWLPYLAMEKRSREENLMNLCDAGYTRGRFLPIDETLRLAIQICDILQTAHSRNIVYRDHKILHYYWLEVYNGVFVIDWNVAKWRPGGVSKVEKQFDLVQFGARALHHIFTGRPAPGALPLGPTRPEEIEEAARTYTPHWTYDDQRLPDRLKEILEVTLAGGYTTARNLREDLYELYMRVSSG